jgi:two-component system chemotaxis response regulator CheB
MATRLVVIGGSDGARRAGEELLAHLPATFPVPIVLALHPATSMLRRTLQRRTALEVVLATSGTQPRPGRAYVAFHGLHLRVDEHTRFAIHSGPSVHGARPSVDHLFESASSALGHGLLAVVLSGATRDGVDGVATVLRRGGRVLVQDPASAQSPTLPNAVLVACRPSAVGTPSALAAALLGALP